MPYQPLAALRVLQQHGVRFVLIGGVAARLWGSPTMTNETDICYTRDQDNLERLAEALRQMGARLRGVDDDVPFLLGATTLAKGQNFTFITDLGPSTFSALRPASAALRSWPRTRPTSTSAMAWWSRCATSTTSSA